MKNIIKYQEIDIELEKLKKKKNAFEELKVIERMKNIVKNAQNNSIKLESDAEELLSEYNRLKEAYKRQHTAIEKLVAKNVEKMNQEEVNTDLVAINSISSELFMIERNLNIVINKISQALRDFENNKKTAIMARNKHKEAKDSYTKKIEALEPKIQKLIQVLKELEPGLNHEIFTKYNSYKNDGIFPVFVNLNGDACGYCRMEIPKNKLDNLKKDSYIICEHCRRVVYK